MAIDTITSEIQRLAGEAYDAFERIQRGDETITTLRDDRPQWVYEAVYAAHSNFLPDDWRYEQIRAAFGAIHDASEGADIQEVGDEFSDKAVDVYTHGRLKWLASNLNRASYCDEAQSEGLTDDADMIERVGMGQYMEAREVWNSVLSSLEEHADEFAEDGSLQ